MAARTVLWAIAGVLGSACGGDDDADGGGTPMCIDTLPESCSAGFDPTWANVHNFVIRQSCGGSISICHGPEGGESDLRLHEKDLAYRALLGLDGTAARVVPNDPACSSLMERLTTDDETRRMPYRSAKLEARTICAVQQWIEQGAKP